VIVLGIETSCDETAVAVVRDGEKILSNVVVSQIPFHRRFGGVVPEIAARQHLAAIGSVLDEAIYQSGFEVSQMDRIAVTVGPGLISSLIVGITVAQTLGIITKKPVFGVNHIIAHLFANFIEHDIGLPFLGLVASGGHCDLIFVHGFNEFELLARTRDDAPGEAFDKIAKFLNLPYPGGVEIEKIARKGNPDAFEIPVPKFKDGTQDFSFSGIKTFVKNTAEKISDEKIPDLLASFQKAVAKIFAQKILHFANLKKCMRVVLAGGVMANSFIVSYLEEECVKNSIQLFWPKKEFCTDNAVMVAVRAFYQDKSLPLTPQSDLI